MQEVVKIQMDKNDLLKKTKEIKKQMEKHSPEILTAIGIAGMITTTIMAVKATPKAIMLIEEQKLDNDVEFLSAFETVQTTWLCYVPSMIVCSGSVICLVCASTKNYKRNTAIATAYTLSESALKDYQEKVLEMVGPKKERTIKDSIAKEKLDNKPVGNTEIIITSSGNTLCFDAISGRYFKTNIDSIKKVVNELNRNMLDEMYISLNEFYYEIGLSSITIGDELGWNISEGLIEIDFSSQLSDDGTPCLVIGYLVAPKYDFSKNY